MGWEEVSIYRSTGSSLVGRGKDDVTTDLALDLCDDSEEMFDAMRCDAVDILKGAWCTRWIRAFRVLFLSFAFFSVNVLCWLCEHYALEGYRSGCGDIACAGFS